MIDVFVFQMVKNTLHRVVVMERDGADLHELDWQEFMIDQSKYNELLRRFDPSTAGHSEISVGLIHFFPKDKTALLAFLSYR